MSHHDRILILDFGSQVTQLIARRLARDRRLLRDHGLQPRARFAQSATSTRTGIIPVRRAGQRDGGARSPPPPDAVFETGPAGASGICLRPAGRWAHLLGGTVEGGHAREFAAPSST
jgi:GMP synthase (glutamine-hydrolysing)